MSQLASVAKIQNPKDKIIRIILIIHTSSTLPYYDIEDVCSISVLGGVDDVDDPRSIVTPDSRVQGVSG